MTCHLRFVTCHWLRKETSIKRPMGHLSVDNAELQQIRQLQNAEKKAITQQKMSNSQKKVILIMRRSQAFTFSALSGVERTET